LIAELQERPDGPQVGDLLAILGRQLETAMKAKRTTQALTIVAGIVRAEQQVSDATRRRQYSIALKRMYSKALLDAIAEAANHPTDREDALLVLRRAGEDGVEVLLDLLVAAPTIEERRGIFMALTGMKEGTDQLVHMLGHHQWFVVRNVAGLASWRSRKPCRRWRSSLNTRTSASAKRSPWRSRRSDRGRRPSRCAARCVMNRRRCEIGRA